MAMNLEQEVKELRSRLDDAVRRIAELEGSFSYITGQLREVQVYLHQNIGARLERVEQKIDKLPGIIAEREPLNR